MSISIVNQLKALHRYVDTTDELAGAEVLEFVDNGYTGTNFERPAMQELLEMVRQSQVNCIIVKDFSRFGRNSIEVGYFMERVFPIYGIRFISLNDEYAAQNTMRIPAVSMWRSNISSVNFTVGTCQ